MSCSCWLVLVSYRAIILAEFLDALGDVLSYVDLTNRASSARFVPAGTVVMVLSVVSFLVNIAAKFYAGVPAKEQLIKSGSAEQRLLTEKRGAVQEKQRASKKTMYEFRFIMLTLCIEDLVSVIFTSYVLLNKENSRGAQFANLLITASVVVYQIISATILWSQSREMERAAATHTVYLDAAVALRNGRVEKFWSILRVAEREDSKARAALCTFEDDGQTLLSVAIDTENIEVAEQLLEKDFKATLKWSSLQASTKNIGEDCLWKAMEHTNPLGFDPLEHPWKDSKAFWKKDAWSKGGVCVDAADEQQNTEQEALIKEALTKPMPRYLYSLGCRRMKGSDRESRAARDAFTYGSLDDVQEQWLHHFSPFAFNSCFMYYTREKGSLFYDDADRALTAERTATMDHFLQTFEPHPDRLVVPYRWTSAAHKFQLTLLQDACIEGRIEDAKKLLEHGANPAAKSGQGQTPFATTLRPGDFAPVPRP